MKKRKLPNGDDGAIPRQFCACGNPIGTILRENFDYPHKIARDVTKLCQCCGSSLTNFFSPFLLTFNNNLDPTKKLTMFNNDKLIIQ